ncbi:unnamed protein product [Cylicocyclus nassatus]|uniref:Uncharacterized protein n=1 Tax=Cylicocyclus nassatus TaxID=53992 RepID=A0AA36GIP1_CYLNA|nr:unnamed protein product [Cylicocyclus nassatus]
MERVYVSSTRMRIFNHIFLLLTVLVVFSAATPFPMKFKPLPRCGVGLMPSPFKFKLPFKKNLKLKSGH